jgi:hypothetical protein
MSTHPGRVGTPEASLARLLLAFIRISGCGRHSYTIMHTGKRGDIAYVV